MAWGWDRAKDWGREFWNPASQFSTGFDPSTQQLGTMTPEQQAYYTQMLAGMQGYEPQQSYTPTAYGGTGYTPTAYEGSQYREQMQPALNRMLSGESAYQIRPETTEQYYRDVIRDPAMKEYEDVTRPAWMSKMGTLHSGARANMEQRGYEDLQSNLQSQRANLYYQDEMARRQALENAAQRQMGGLGIAQGMSQQDLAQWQAQNQMAQAAEQQAMQQWLGENQMSLQSAQFGAQQQALPYQMMLQALGLPAMENIVSQPGTVQGLMTGFGNLFPF